MFSEADVLSDYELWQSAVLPGCRTLRSNVLEVCSIMRANGLNPHDPNDLAVALVLGGAQDQALEMSAAVTVWCD